MAANSPEPDVVLFTVKEAAQVLRCSRETLYRRISAGEVESTKLGGSRFLTEAQLADYVERSARAGK